VGGHEQPVAGGVDEDLRQRPFGLEVDHRRSTAQMAVHLVRPLGPAELIPGGTQEVELVTGAAQRH
jgi:hypothetical protein